MVVCFLLFVAESPCIMVVKIRFFLSRYTESALHSSIMDILVGLMTTTADPLKSANIKKKNDIDNARSHVSKVMKTHPLINGLTDQHFNEMNVLK